MRCKSCDVEMELKFQDKTENTFKCPKCGETCKAKRAHIEALKIVGGILCLGLLGDNLGGGGGSSS